MSPSEVSERQSERLSAVPLRRPSRASLRSLPCEARVQIGSLDDIVAARQQGRALCAQLGFSNCNLTLIATAIFEIARNTLEYATCGEVIITPVRNGSREGVKIVVTDQGPGIADLSLVMRDGYSTGNGLGIGLPGTRRLMDEFEITSEIGTGTTVTMKKWAA
jgi:serine/threonine-protein kinase RsbT